MWMRINIGMVRTSLPVRRYGRWHQSWCESVHVSCETLHGTQRLLRVSHVIHHGPQ